MEDSCDYSGMIITNTYNGVMVVKVRFHKEIEQTFMNIAGKSI